MRVSALIVIALLGCSKKEPAPETKGSNSVAPAVDAAVAVAADAAAATPPPSKQADCLTAQDPDNPIGFAIGRVDKQLVICGGNSSGLVGCWNVVDAKTGKVAARATAPLPGVGFAIDAEKLPKPNCYQDLCWPKGGGDSLGFTMVAYHPDGKRVAILADDIVVFDVATKKPIKTVPLHKTGDGNAGDNEITNSPGGLWFVGETLYVRGNDAGPASGLFVYPLDGKSTPPLWGLYHGAVAVDDGKLYVNEDGLSTLSILDGKSKKVVTRKVPKGPCKLEENPEWGIEGEDDPKWKKCSEYLAKHYIPYENAQVLPDGANYVGFTGGKLIQLDGKLAETSHVELATCK